MKKIAILGCENSHADIFLEMIQSREEFADLEVVGIYSEEPEACAALHERFGVPVMAHYADAAGQVDGLIITARHGGKHYPYAKPYLAAGIPVFVDKPVTISEEDAIAFMQDLQANGCPVCGGSSLRHAKEVAELKQLVETGVGGATRGGIVRAPLSMENEYGGFFFYAQHVVEILSAVFGRYPECVQAVCDVHNNVSAIFRYADYDAVGFFQDENPVYYVARLTEEGMQGGEISTESVEDWFYGEFKEFCGLLNGEIQPMSYQDFAAPVFVFNAVWRSLQNGEEEPVHPFQL